MRRTFGGRVHRGFVRRAGAPRHERRDAGFVFNREKKRKKARLRRFQDHYCADLPVDLEEIGEFRGEAFPLSGPLPWLDRANAFMEIEEKQKRGALDAVGAEQCRKWIVDGYAIVEGAIPAETLDATWAAYERDIAAGKITPPQESHGEGDPWPGRCLDPHILIPEVKALLHHPRLVGFTDMIFGRRTLPFQTIIGHKGSAQRAHSDSIHMTTYPMGYLAAAWIAFEDIHPDSGPLFYYPRSHRMTPYLLSGDVGIQPRYVKENGFGVYAERYEPAVQKHLDAAGLEQKSFQAKKGDVLFWHANLVHGGLPRNDLRWSRKAVVCHYFAEGAFTYHDLSGNASRLHRAGVLAPVTLD